MEAWPRLLRASQQEGAQGLDPGGPLGSAGQTSQGCPAATPAGSSWPAQDFLLGQPCPRHPNPDLANLASQAGWSVYVCARVFTCARVCAQALPMFAFLCQEGLLLDPRTRAAPKASDSSSAPAFPESLSWTARGEGQREGLQASVWKVLGEPKCQAPRHGRRCSEPTGLPGFWSCFLPERGSAACTCTCTCMRCQVLTSTVLRCLANHDPFPNWKFVRMRSDHKDCDIFSHSYLVGPHHAGEGSHSEGPICLGPLRQVDCY